MSPGIWHRCCCGGGVIGDIFIAFTPHKAGDDRSRIVLASYSLSDGWSFFNFPRTGSNINPALTLDIYSGGQAYAVAYPATISGYNKLAYSELSIFGDSTDLIYDGDEDGIYINYCDYLAIDQIDGRYNVVYRNASSNIYVYYPEQAYHSPMSLGLGQPRGFAVNNDGSERMFMLSYVNLNLGANIVQGVIGGEYSNTQVAAVHNGALAPTNVIYTPTHGFVYCWHEINRSTNDRWILNSLGLNVQVSDEVYNAWPSARIAAKSNGDVITAVDSRENNSGTARYLLYSADGTLIDTLETEAAVTMTNQINTGIHGFVYSEDTPVITVLDENYKLYVYAKLGSEWTNIVWDSELETQYVNTPSMKSL